MHRRPSARLSQKPHHPLQPRAQPPQPTTRHIIPALPALAKHPLLAQLPPMHAAYHGGSATSAASSFRDSVPATLPQLLRCNCLHTPRPPLGSPLANPHHLYSPARNRLSQKHTTSSMHSRRSQAPAHSPAAADARQRTSEVQRRQLRHPSETRRQRRCPS
jgi:hypothetical protein